MNAFSREFFFHPPSRMFSKKALDAEIHLLTLHSHAEDMGYARQLILLAGKYNKSNKNSFLVALFIVCGLMRFMSFFPQFSLAFIGKWLSCKKHFQNLNGK